MVIERIVFVPSVTSRLPPPTMPTVASAAAAPPLARRPFWIAASACVIVIGARVIDVDADVGAGIGAGAAVVEIERDRRAVDVDGQRLAGGHHRVGVVGAGRAPRRSRSRCVSGASVMKSPRPEQLAALGCPACRRRSWAAAAG